MRWPELVPAAACRTPCVIRLEGNIGEDGAPETAEVHTRCNWQSTAEPKQDAVRRQLRAVGTALLAGDPMPGAELPAGTVEIGGVRGRIRRAGRCRNPDGTVNYTRLEVE